MDRDAIRAFALRDRTAVEALRYRHWAEVWRTRGPEAMLRVAWALREHARRVRPDWPGAAARAEDLEHHVAQRRLLERAGRALTAR